ncbi:hypothetical protein [Amaricoccus sp.]|uniref:hypothetical protein n=1 Tax=Amaricoccus sp. TaxID=1872485 RepID=UPI001B493CB3|nr:hypothetical protein [Amaricoccus sp.]MBP7000023.1 hypothetical protein [Amaricoccus sp.]
MRTDLLRRAFRHRNAPGIRLWLCGDGSGFAVVPGALRPSGCPLVIYTRATWGGPSFAYPAWPGGVGFSREVAREFIENDGCAPRKEPDWLPWRAALRQPPPFETLVSDALAFQDTRATPDEESTLVRDKWVHIFCDYSADGVWEKDGGACCAEELPVSPELIERIRAWQMVYETNEIYRGVTEWEHEEQFCREGREIAHAVKAALPDWTVIYLDEGERPPARWPKGDREKSAHDPAWRIYFEYEVFGSPEETRTRRVATAAELMGLVAGETRLRSGDGRDGVFEGAVEFRDAALWVAVRTANGPELWGDRSRGS